MRASVAVRLDIRPRLQLSAEPRLPARRGFRLPALAIPAAGYWVFMAALTYVFAHLGPHPLDAFASERAVANEPLAEPPPAEEPEVRQPEITPPQASPAVAAPAPVASVDTERDADPATLAPTSPEPALRDTSRHEAADRREASTANVDRPTTALPADATIGSFPEFSDSTPAPHRDRAADGPRIESLFERAEREREPAPVASALPAPAGEPKPAAGVTSCEAAVARNNEQLDLGGPRGPVDITREAYASILQNGRYLAACSPPERTVIEICAAVKNGRAVGVTVSSNPPRATLDACVRSAVARLAFPSNERLDVTHTRFDAVAR
jgi:hypothetical protein